ncbi:MAG: tRNA (guanosine(46)-N7)-methyltransferase TrmB [Clostridiales bacterium]|jgi:tRNA (guanine-N7-)-methyltransferase|nr:tRNA (guanosine(46)-N7)-methyltransferase TrmB [Clostridiales bacterium]
MRLRQKPWADKEFAENPMYIPNPRQLSSRWQGLFGNDNPMHLEIGCGKGRFIVENALRHPDINFIAMEKFEKIICMALRHAGLAAGCLPNLRLFREDARDIVEIFSQGELSRIYINFCDPWRARGKWRKRRLTHRDFLAKYESIMTDDIKEIHFKTDNVPLFNFSVAELEEAGWRLQNVTYDLHNSGFTENIMTEYEERFAAEGLKICRLEAQKLDGR